MVSQRLDPAWAWTAFEPEGKQGWDWGCVVHLYRRAAFGATWEQVERALVLGPEKAVDQLLHPPKQAEQFYTQMDQVALALLSGDDATNLPPWWLYVIRFSPDPLRERAALFWHDHFATSAAKVTSGMLMWRQNRLFRRLGLGPFGTLLEQVAKDPAMMLWLDGALNRRRRPNENFAREVMELFTLGLGHYSEQDIKEAARAFTGWRLRRLHGDWEFYFDFQEHDSGEKVVLGRRGRWRGEDVLQILLDHPATARFLVRKWCQYLISQQLPWTDELIEPLAQDYRQHNYDTRWLLRTMLRSNLFYSPQVRFQKVKSPVDFALGILVALGGTTNFRTLAQRLNQLGQRLFYPPNVAGWPRGTAWLNSATLVGRLNLAWELGSSEGRIPWEQILQKHELRTREQAAQWLCRLFLGHQEVASQVAQAVPPTRPSPQTMARLLQALAAVPVFQLA